MLEARMATAARRRQAVSQSAMAKLLAKAVGHRVHQPQVSSWEAGAEPPLDIILAYEQLSGLSRNYLAWGDSPVGETSHVVPRFPQRPVNPQDVDDDRGNTGDAKGR